MYSKILGKTVRYSGYFPQNYSLNVRFHPILYHLHGGGPGRDTDLTGPSRIPHFMDTLIAKENVLPMIIISPDARRDEQECYATFYMNDVEGMFRWKDMFFQEFIPYIEKRYRVLKQSETGETLRAVSGISMGGFGAMSYALQRPGFFVAGAVLSAALRSASDIEAMSQSEYERRYAKVLGAGLKGKERMATQYPQCCPLCIAEAGDGAEFSKARLFFSCGGEDEFVRGASKLHSILKKKQVPHQYRVHPGEHNWEYWRSELPDMLRFIAQAFSDARDRK